LLLPLLVVVIQGGRCILNDEGRCRRHRCRRGRRLPRGRRALLLPPPLLVLLVLF
jgi:hypothetical protein